MNNDSREEFTSNSKGSIGDLVVRNAFQAPMPLNDRRTQYALAQASDNDPFGATLYLNSGYTSGDILNNVEESDAGSFLPVNGLGQPGVGQQVAGPDSTWSGFGALPIVLLPGRPLGVTITGFDNTGVEWRPWYGTNPLWTKRVWVVNAGYAPCVFSHNSELSSSGNRLYFNSRGNYIMAPGQSIVFIPGSVDGVIFYRPIDEELTLW